MSPPAVARFPCMLPSVRACTASAIIGLGGGAGDDAARGSSRAPASGARGSSAEGALSFCTIRIDDTERRASASSTDMRDTRRRVLADFGSSRRSERARARGAGVRRRKESAPLQEQRCSFILKRVWRSRWRL
jgi:hypothetical protein